MVQTLHWFEPLLSSVLRGSNPSVRYPPAQLSPEDAGFGIPVLGKDSCCSQSHQPPTAGPELSSLPKIRKCWITTGLNPLQNPNTKLSLGSSCRSLCAAAAAQWCGESPGKPFGAHILLSKWTQLSLGRWNHSSSGTITKEILWKSWKSLNTSDGNWRGRTTSRFLPLKANPLGRASPSFKESHRCILERWPWQEFQTAAPDVPSGQCSMPREQMIWERLIFIQESPWHSSIAAWSQVGSQAGIQGFQKCSTLWGSARNLPRAWKPGHRPGLEQQERTGQPDKHLYSSSKGEGNK